MAFVCGAGVPKWPKGRDSRSPSSGFRGFESLPPHQAQSLVPFPISLRRNMWKADLDAGETGRNYERALKRLDSAKNIHPNDKEDIKRFINHLLVESIGKERVIARAKV
jgi:hypothetical protein